MIDSNNKRNSYRENTRGANQYDRQQIESVAKKIQINIASWKIWLNSLRSCNHDKI
jgi:hypothetical protein